MEMNNQKGSNVESHQGSKSAQHKPKTANNPSKNKDNSSANGQAALQHESQGSTPPLNISRQQKQQPRSTRHSNPNPQQNLQCSSAQRVTTAASGQEAPPSTFTNNFANPEMPCPQTKFARACHDSCPLREYTNNLRKKNLEFRNNQAGLIKRIQQLEEQLQVFQQAQIDTKNENQKLKSQFDLVVQQNIELQQQIKNNCVTKTMHRKTIDKVLQTKLKYEQIIVQLLEQGDQTVKDIVVDLAKSTTTSQSQSLHQSSQFEGGGLAHQSRLKAYGGSLESAQSEFNDKDSVISYTKGGLKSQWIKNMPLGKQSPKSDLGNVNSSHIVKQTDNFFLNAPISPCHGQESVLSCGPNNKQFGSPLNNMEQIAGQNSPLFNESINQRLPDELNGEDEEGHFI